jgi:hypothetical protein
MATDNTAPKKRKRVAVDVSQLSLDFNKLRFLAGASQELWDRMPDSEKILLFAQRGIDASLATIDDATRAAIESSES